MFCRVSIFVRSACESFLCVSTASCAGACPGAVGFDGLLPGTRLAIASPAAGVPSAFYLVYANRSRAAGLRGAFSALRRSIVERRAKNALEETLRSIRSRLESDSR